MSHQAPSAPSGAKPAQLKSDSKRRGRKPGAKPGHRASTRKQPNPVEIDREESHTLNACPECNEPFGKPASVKRSRIIIDIIIPQKPEIVKHHMDRCWCSHCRRYFEPVVTDALPGFTIGLRTIVYSAFLHYGQGLSVSRTVKNLSLHGMKLSGGELLNAWQNLAEVLRPEYDAILEHIRSTTSAVHADETGHRQKGKRFWMWVFATKTHALFLIRRRRNSAVVLEVLGREFGGILVTDFWKPYLATAARLRQWCVAHLLREFKKIEFRESRPPPEYYRFKKVVRRLFADALRFSCRMETTSAEREAAHARFLRRLKVIASGHYRWPDVRRLSKRLSTYSEGLFTFVSEEDVDATNNHAERTIRSAVILRKIQFHTMSDAGSRTMETLISILRTLELQGKDPYTELLRMARESIPRPAHQLEKETVRPAA